MELAADDIEIPAALDVQDTVTIQLPDTLSGAHGTLNTQDFIDAGDVESGRVHFRMHGKTVFENGVAGMASAANESLEANGLTLDDILDLAKIEAGRMDILLEDFDIVSCYRMRRQDSLMRKINGWLWTRVIRLAFSLKIRDVDCAFKLYRREVIAGVAPLLSRHFNLTVEIPLKAMIRGYRYAIVPITWRNRTSGVSKLKIKEMGSRYLFIVLYILLEKYFSRGDYLRKEKISVQKDIKHG